MGYYTGFTLNVCCAKTTNVAVLDEEIERLDVFDSGDVECGYLGTAKWYDYDKDMLLLSARFPDVLFELTGEGEEREDCWKNYYMGGRVMRGGIEIQVVYHDFDPAKLEGDPIQDVGQEYSYEN